MLKHRLHSQSQFYKALFELVFLLIGVSQLKSVNIVRQLQKKQSFYELRCVSYREIKWDSFRKKIEIQKLISTHTKSYYLKKVVVTRFF